MKKEDYIHFLKGGLDFAKGDYLQLGKEDRQSLWVFRLTYDLLSRNPEVDPLSKFTRSNYLLWKSIDPNVDEFIEYIINEYFSGWSLQFEGAKERTIKEEIYRRINEC